MKIKYICDKCGKEYINKTECLNCELSHEEIKILSKEELNIINTKYKIEMSKILDISNTELAHSQADDLLIDFLTELGFIQLANMFENVDKWYS